jgi:SAM-dependent methyltransferase
VELYDIAFGWDVSAEVDWLVERLGPGFRSVLEPGCGTGRTLEALAQRGLEVTGVDSSPSMAAFARQRVPAANVFIRHMAEFDLGRTFGGAVSAVSTVGLLSPDELGRHLEAMARHLERGASYLVQQALVAAEPELWRSEWDAERDGLRLHIVWEALEQDSASQREESRSRVEILSGPRAGEVVEDVHASTWWSVDAWRDLVAASPLTQVACYDGRLPERPPVELEQGGGYLWHQLVAP